MLRKPGVVLAVLTGLNLVNYVDRFLLAAVGPKLQDDLGLSNFEFGLLVNAFMLGYFATSPVFGALGDRLQRKGLIALGVGVFSVATAASGMMKSFASMAVARLAVGVGEASYATLAPTIIDDLAGPTRKERWMAIFYVAIPVGSALGFVLGGWLEHAFGWRNAFLLTGGPGLLLAALVPFLGEPPRAPLASRAGAPARDAAPDAAAARAAPSGGASGYAALARIPAYRDAVLGYAAYTFALGGFAAWAPKYLYAQLGMQLKAADFWLGVVLVASGLLATFIGAELAARTPGRSRAHASQRLCAVTVVVAAPLAVLTLIVHSPTAFFVSIAATEFALFLSTAPINVVILGAVPEGLRASAMAASIFAIHLLGDLISPPLVGALADVRPLGDAMLVLPAAIAVAAFFWARASRRLGAAALADAPADAAAAPAAGGPTVRRDGANG